MAPLVTHRMVLLPLTRAMMRARLEHHAFDLECRLPSGPATVRFPPAWPGDALALFAGNLEWMPADLTEVPGTFAAIASDRAVAIGQLGTVGPPTLEGAQEIGYGFDEAVWGQGLATEAVSALTAHLLTWGSVRTVTAETAKSNRASQRVLEKVGFCVVGTRRSDQEGDVVSWQYEPTAGLDLS